MSRQSFGRYEILAELGHGGMAVVYHARDPRFKRDVAIKVLPREFLHNPQFRVRFEREAEVIAALEHPSIVPVYDFGEEDGQPYLVMRYIGGGSLAQRLEAGPLPLGEAVRIFRQIAPALDKAHARGIIHRDLKPGNILFDGDDHPYLSDFGIVKLMESTGSLTDSGIIGTPTYMSPEQINGVKDLDGRSDLYSLGAVLFHMLAGDIPYQADTLAGLMYRHVYEDVPSLRSLRPDLSPGVEAVIHRAMAKDRQARFESAGEMVRALDRAAADVQQPISPARPERGAARGKPVRARRRSAAWIGIGAALLSLAAILLAGAAGVGAMLLGIVDPPAFGGSQPATRPAETDEPSRGGQAAEAGPSVEPTGEPARAPTLTVAPTVELPPAPLLGPPDECDTDPVGCAVIHPGETIKIGMTATFGSFESFGADLSQGGQLAIEQASDLPGFEFELVVKDDELDAGRSAEVAGELAQDPTVVAIAGSPFFTVTQATIPIFEEAGLPMMSLEAAYPELLALESPVFNAIGLTNEMQGLYIARYLYEPLEARRVAVMYEEFRYSMEIKDALVAEFTRLGGEIVADEIFEYDTGNYLPQLQAIAAAAPDALYFCGLSGDAQVTLEQMTTVGLGSILFFGCDGLAYGDWAISGAPGHAGIYAASTEPPDSPQKDAFNAAYEELWGAPPDRLTGFAWYAYDAVDVLVKVIGQVAIRSGDGNLYVPRGALIDAVRDVSDFQGVTGTITCDERGQCRTAGPTFYQLQDGDWVHLP